MKKLFLLLLVLSVFAIVGCSPVADQETNPPTALGQGLVALPDEGSLLVLSLVTAGLTWLLLKINMGQYTQPLAAVIAPIIITAIERALGTIPPVFDNLVLSLIHLLVLFVSGSIGTFILFKRAKQPKTLLQNPSG